MELKVKKCLYCDTTLTAENFSPSFVARKYYCCCTCHKKRYKKYFRNRHLKQYDLTEVEFEKLYKSQNGACKICLTKQPKRNKGVGTFGVIHIDHDHETGKVRGLLCSKCNTSLGHFRDSIELLEKAITYLKGG
jgi:hypothetical protein